MERELTSYSTLKQFPVEDFMKYLVVFVKSEPPSLLCGASLLCPSLHSQTPEVKPEPTKEPHSCSSPEHLVSGRKRQPFSWPHQTESYKLKDPGTLALVLFLQM